MADQQSVLVRYRNWKGEVRVRRIMPILLWFGNTQWHQEPQWMLQAVDVEAVNEYGDHPIKDFAMSGMLEWGVPIENSLDIQTEETRVHE